jgi:ATP-binding cassette, subfamily B, bacterial PglK
MDNDLFQLIKKIFSVIGRRNKIRYIVLIGFVLITALIEMLSIGSVIPLLMALGDASRLFTNPDLKIYWDALGLVDANQLPFLLACSFGILALLSGIMRILMTFIIAQINRDIILEFGRKIYQSTIFKTFEEHSMQNSSEIVGVLTSKIAVLSLALNALSSMLSATIISLAVVFFLFQVEPEILLSIMGAFGLLYFAIIQYYNSVLRKNSQIAAFQTSNLIRLLKETLDGIREIILNNSQNFFIDSYTENDHKLRSAQARIGVIAVFPRFMIEALGLFGIAMFSLYLIEKGDGTLSSAIPSLALIAMAVQRLLPLGQQIYNGWATIIGAADSVHDTLNVILASKVTPENFHEELPPLPFNQKISISNLSYSYTKSTPFIVDVNLEIPQGSKVGIFGATGSGKSTFMDLLMGFLTPDSGEICIDDIPLSQDNIRAWQQNIAHVPQKIFIQDSTIGLNIAMSKIDGAPPNKSALAEASAKADILKFINSSPKGFDQKVGENGELLSGGQIQRIGIARALYKRAKLIVLDEPTSSLDESTEDRIIETIHSLQNDCTVFIISHSKKVIEDCDIKIELKNGQFTIKS